MKVEDLKKITLSTPLYHPFLGKGFPVNIMEQSVDVFFREGVRVTFSLSYMTDKCTGLEHIFTYPVKVVPS